MPGVLFHLEQNAMGRDFAYLDRLLGMFGMIPIVIDPSIEEERHYGAHFYPSLADAVFDARWDGFTWVWLDHKGSETLEEFQHPGDDVIYCVGSDADGFASDAYSGPRVRLPDDMVDDQTYATLIIPVICGHHRWGG
jgi:hypothetical protein